MGRTVGRLRRARAEGLAGAARARSGGGRPDRLGDDGRGARARRRAGGAGDGGDPASVCSRTRCIKNYIATEFLYDYLKDKKSVGVIDEDPERALEYVAEPIGVVLALLPITNPTSTALFKSIVCAKTRNALIMRPSARRRTLRRPRRRAPAGGRRGGGAAAARAAGHPRPVARRLAVPVPPPRGRLHLDDRRAEGGGGGERRRQAMSQRRLRQRARSTCTAAPTSGWWSSTS